MFMRGAFFGLSLGVISCAANDTATGGSTAQGGSGATTSQGGSGGSTGSFTTGGAGGGTCSGMVT